jgi:hypothetical protein
VDERTLVVQERMERVLDIHRLWAAINDYN